MKKQLCALLIAASISTTTPLVASVSSFASGYCGGVGTVLCLIGAKKIREAKSYLKVTGAATNSAADQAPAVMHEWTTDYKHGFAMMGSGFLAYIIMAALLLNQ